MVEEVRQEQEEEEDDGGSTPNLQYRAAHQAVRERWRDTDDTMCRHSMSFHLHHTLRSEFFASYLYLVEKIPLGEQPLHLDLLAVSEVGVRGVFWALCDITEGCLWERKLMSR